MVGEGAVRVERRMTPRAPYLSALAVALTFGALAYAQDAPKGNDLVTFTKAEAALIVQRLHERTERIAALERELTALRLKSGCI